VKSCPRWPDHRDGGDDTRRGRAVYLTGGAPEDHKDDDERLADQQQQPGDPADPVEAGSRLKRFLVSIKNPPG